MAPSIVSFELQNVDGLGTEKKTFYSFFPPRAAGPQKLYYSWMVRWTSGELIMQYSFKFNNYNIVSILLLKIWSTYNVFNFNEHDYPFIA
jgi:hypothetical protein